MTICANCVSGHVLPGDPTGSTDPASGCYLALRNPAIAGRADANKTAIVLLTDIIGLRLKNAKLLADRFAQSYLMAYPRLIPPPGHPPVRLIDDEANLRKFIPDEPGAKFSLWNRFQFLFLILRCAPGLWKTRPSIGRERVQAFIRDLKENKGYEKIGVIGYCYGGGIAIKLAMQKGMVDAVVSCHPGPVWLDDFPRVVVPFALFCPEEDEWLSPAKRDRAEAALKVLKNVPTKVQTFSGTVHGFCCRPALGIPKVQTAFEGAFEEGVAWFQTHL
ncbi:SubName: Full=Related to dienelactone hydrolase endo-1,3,1,4-beta-D-glucanase-Laccaria bicolor {ECO:0000313/EMBL:CCA70526.1} [Serendipita indica DSM 11827]|nr:SubName: Full=Related to dienelactone hydrolase endo-1,3,1,4-beta-D-glucanase-Laccaria bicolor {ECO:0000313/EMBL:CCA70526.1} [Serendipita indica DSM 11827]